MGILAMRYLRPDLSMQEVFDAATANAGQVAVKQAEISGFDAWQAEIYVNTVQQAVRDLAEEFGLEHS
jgi:hypothetical protein